ncbi:calcium uniporter protein 2 [Forsythia ovata]|uniref:Calcium uniporter protein 2 n=1 Tax=Forsythia ovata TaxID=205694 RepID=A0ABD1TSY1_9LAMI
MAFKKTLAHRSRKYYSSMALTNFQIFSSSTAVNAPSNPKPKPNKLALDHGDDGIFQRYLHRHLVATSHELRYQPPGEKLLKKLWGMDITRERIRLEGLRPLRGRCHWRMIS